MTLKEQVREYLSANVDKRPNKERLHTQLILDFIDNIGHYNIRKPYEIYREVRIIGKKGEFKTQSDLIILNSKLYIVEAKVLRPDNWQKKDKPLEKRLQLVEGDIFKQVRPAYEFFQREFNQDLVGLGIYRLEGEDEIHHKFFKL